MSFESELNPDINILNSKGYTLLPDAKKRLKALDERRRSKQAPFMKEKYYMNGVWVLLHSMVGFTKIIMWGGVYPHIMFEAENGVLTDYNYDLDSLSYAAKTEITDELHPTFNGTVHVGENTAVTYKKGWKKTALDPSMFHIANDQKHELELLGRGGFLIGRTSTGEGIVASRQGISTDWMDDYAQAMGNGQLIYLPSLRTGMWSLINGPEYWVFNPASQSLFSSSWWVPNIMYAEAGNGILVTGVYYGSLDGDAWVGKDDPNPESPGEPASTAKVTFNGLLDNRKPDAILGYGYAETLVSLDDQYFNTIYFYLYSTPMVDYGNPSILNQELLYNRDCGTIMHGKPWTFSIEPGFEIPTGEDYSVSFWTTDDLRIEGDLSVITNDYVGIVISYGNKAEAYLYTGATYTLFTTEFYHSHSYSSDGRILAIFEQGEDGTIGRVIVFDLNNYETPNDPTTRFIPSTPIQDSLKPASLGATRACVIPWRFDPTKKPTELGYSLEEATPFVAGDDVSLLKALAPFGHLKYNKLQPTGLFWNKVVIEDGIHAEMQINSDTCMRGNVTIIDVGISQDDGIAGTFNISIEGVTYTGSWSEVLQQLPYVLWSSPSWPYEVALCKWEQTVDGPRGIPISVEASGTDHTVSVYTIEEPTLVIFAKALGGFDVEGALGDYEITEYEIPDVSNHCPGTFEYDLASVRDECGRTASVSDETTLVCSVSFSKTGDPDKIAIGDEITATGGKLPYSMTLTAGNINVTGDVGIVTSLPGCPSLVNVNTLTVKDSCGCESVQDFLVDYDNRTWILQSITNYSSGAYTDTTEETGSCCGGTMLCGTTCYDYPPVITSDTMTVMQLGAVCGSWCTVDNHWRPCLGTPDITPPADFHDYCWNDPSCYSISLGPTTFCRAYVSQQTIYKWECPP